MEIERYYKKLVESLRLLSLTFNEQMKYFPEFADLPFEILDTFEKAFSLLPQLLEANKIAYNIMPNLLRLHNLINLELRNPDFDTLACENLCNSEEWDKIRELARETLKFMDEPFRKPESSYI